MSAQSGVSEKTSNETSTKPKDIWTRVLEWNHEKSSPSQSSVNSITSLCF